MKINEIRQLSDEELETELDRLHRRVFDLHSQAVTEKLEDSSLIPKAKRDIARVLTVVRQRDLAAQAVGENQAE